MVSGVPLTVTHGDFYSITDGKATMDGCLPLRGVLLILFVVHYTVCQDILKYSTAVETGKNKTLSCAVSSHVSNTLWLFRGRGQGDSNFIVQGKKIFKTDRYGLAVDNSTLALTVIHAEEEDDGTYFYQESGATTAQFDLVVEIPPVVYLRKQNEIIDDTLDVVFKEESSIQCVANGSKPLVSLSWEVNNKEETGAITVDDSRQDERIIVSKLQYIPNIEDKTLTCVTGGQEAVEQKNVVVSVNVQYEPICNLLFTNESTNEFRLICSCEANPVPTTYNIYVNDTLLVSEKEALISSKYSATAYCSATNIIGTDTSDTVDLAPFVIEQPLSNWYVGLIVAMASLVLIMILIAVIALWYRKKKKKADHTKEEFNKIDNQVDLNLVSQQHEADIELPPEDNDQSTQQGETEPMVKEKPRAELKKQINKVGDKELE